MKTTSVKPIILTCFVLILSELIGIHCAHFVFGAQLDEDLQEARMRLQEAYNATVEVERRGVDLTEVKEQLNEALNYIIEAERIAGQGDTELANLWIEASTQKYNKILSLVEELQQSAEATEKTKIVVYLAIILVVIIFCTCVVFLGKRAFRRYQQKKFMNMNLKAGRVHS